MASVNYFASASEFINPRIEGLELYAQSRATRGPVSFSERNFQALCNFSTNPEVAKELRLSRSGSLYVLYNYKGIWKVFQVIINFFKVLWHERGSKASGDAYQAQLKAAVQTTMDGFFAEHLLPRIALIAELCNLNFCNSRHQEENYQTEVDRVLGEVKAHLIPEFLKALHRVEVGGLLAKPFPPSDKFVVAIVYIDDAEIETGSTEIQSLVRSINQYILTNSGHLHSYWRENDDSYSNLVR